MDVTLPNGRIVTGVPDDITQAELARIAVDNNLATAEDFGELLSEEDTTFLGALGEAGKRALGGVYTGGVDVLGGLGQLAPGIDDQSMVDMSRTARAETAEALGYDPAYSEDFITEDGFDADRFVAQLGGVIGNMAPQVLALAIPGARERNLARFAT